MGASVYKASFLSLIYTFLVGFFCINSQKAILFLCVNCCACDFHDVLRKFPPSFLLEDSGLESLRPMVIDFTKLQSPAPEESETELQKSGGGEKGGGGGGGGGRETAESASLAAVRSPAPITVPSPR